MLVRVPKDNERGKMMIWMGAALTADVRWGRYVQGRHFCGLQQRWRRRLDFCNSNVESQGMKQFLKLNTAMKHAHPNWNDWLHTARWLVLWWWVFFPESQCILPPNVSRREERRRRNCNTSYDDEEWGRLRTHPGKLPVTSHPSKQEWEKVEGT